MPWRFFIVILLWAAIYLPWLGGAEYYSEEGHRVMPAIEMLESGNYLVPQIFGQPYFNKPPLLNWLIAASFKCFGQSEWSARFVSACAVLLVALVFVLATRRDLGRNGALLAALIWLTSFALVEKGRMAEIEALYSAIFALALIAWLKLWRAGRSAWLIWSVPYIFLGVGLLAKGPAHLVFFYCVVGAILYHADQLGELARLPHFVGLAIALGIFALWAVPYQLALQGTTVSQAWSREVMSPLLGHEAEFRGWSMNFPRGFAYFLPWLVLLPFIRFNRIADTRERAIARGLLWGAAVPFVVLLLLPYTYPRYVIPLLAAICWLIGLAWNANAFEWRIPKLQLPVSPYLIAAFVSIACLAAIIIWPARATAELRGKPKLKARAAQIDRYVLPNEWLYVFDPSFQPYLLYVKARLRYIASLEELPPDAHYLLTKSSNCAAIAKNPRWAGSPPKVVQQTESYRQISTALLQLRP